MRVACLLAALLLGTLSLCACGLFDGNPAPDTPPVATRTTAPTDTAALTAIPPGPTRTPTGIPVPATPTIIPHPKLPGLLPEGALIRIGKGSLTTLASRAGILALGSTAGVCLYAEHGLEEQWCARTERPVQSLALAPQAARLAVGLTDGQLLLWDVETQTEIGSRRIGQYDGPHFLEFSPDGLLLAVSIPGKLALWDGLALAEEQQRLSTTAAFFAPLRFSPDGRYLAWIEQPTNTYTARVFDLLGREVVAEYPLQLPAQALNWTPDGRELVIGLTGGPDCIENCIPSGETEGAVLFYPLAEGEPRELGFDFADRSVRDLALSPDGLFLALQAGYYEPRLLIVDVRGDEPLDLPVRMDPYRSSLTWGEQGLYFLDENVQLRFWARGTTTAEALTPIGFSSPPAAQALSPDGSRLARAFYQAGTLSSVTIRSLPEGALLTELQVDPSMELFDLRWSPDGSRLALAGYKSVEVFDLVSAEQRQILDLPLQDSLSTLAWTSDSAAVLVGLTHYPEEQSQSEQIREEILVLAADRGVVQSRLELNSDLGGAMFSLAPDGKNLAVHAWSRTGASADLSIWDLQTGLHTRSLTLDFGLYAFTWTSEGDALVAFQDRSLIRIDPFTGVEAWSRSLGPLHRDEIGAARLSVSPDGRWVATAGREIGLWQAASGERVQTLSGHTLRVQQIFFSADSSQLFTSSEDGTVIIWSLP